MTTPTYYIEVDTYWQNSKSFFIGPFNSRKEAEAWYVETPVNANLWRNDSMCGGDIKTAWRVYPIALSKTFAIKRGMRDDFEHGYNVFPVDTEPTANALSQARMNLHANYN